MMSEYNFVETNPDDLYNAIVRSVMDACNEPLYPGDERRIFAEAVVSLFVTLYSNFNDKAKQRLLRFARGVILDGIGELLGVTRSAPAHAYATFRFTVAAVQSENIIIPQGTRITTDGSAYFATDTIDVLQAGETYVDVRATCTEGGSAYNGFAAETIATLVDLIPYIDSAKNITISNGGDDGEPYTEEGDDRLRERIRLAPSTLTTAGPESSYIYFAMTADPDIIDVELDTPSANVVNIYPLMKGGELPGDDVLRAVEAACSASDRRPMTDKVTAMAPETVEYGINIHYYCTMENEADVIAAIEGAGGAIDQYNEWQQGALGRSVNPDYLRKLIFSPGDGLVGADRITVTEPVFAEVDKKSVARLSGPITVTHEVIV